MGAQQQILLGMGGGAAAIVPVIGLSHSGTGQIIAYSTNNATSFDESSYTTPADQDWNGMAYDGTYLVSVSASGDSNKYAIRSSDKGKTWSLKTLPVVANWVDVATNGTGTFVAVGTTSAPNQAIAISTDSGATWSTSNLGQNFLPQRVVWNGAVFCIIGRAFGNTATNQCFTSPDGASSNWTSRVMHDTKFWGSICWSGTKLVATDSDGNQNVSNTSVDNGVTWVAGGAPPASTLFGAGLVSNGSRVVSPCGDSSGNSCYSDDDGASWHVASFATNAVFRRMTWNGTVYVAARNGVINWSSNGSTGWTAVSTTAAFGNCIGSPYLTFGTF